jgi:hypothetical protein
MFGEEAICLFPLETPIAKARTNEGQTGVYAVTVVVFLLQVRTASGAFSSFYFWDGRCPMKLHGKRWALIVALAALALLPAWAQHQGRHMGMAGRHYDTSAEVRLKGTVAEVKEVECEMCGSAMGTHLVLKTEAESMEVMLGPTAFLKKHNFAVANGDEIEVTGAKIKIDDQDELLAREVKKGEKTLTLRDKTGKPMWAGGRDHRH